MTPDGELQATVERYDASTRAGTVLLDDGRRVEFAGDAVRPPVRLLRPGQRVRLRVRSGVTVALTLGGLPLDDVPPGGCSTMGP